MRCSNITLNGEVLLRMNVLLAKPHCGYSVIFTGVSYWRVSCNEVICIR